MQKETILEVGAEGGSLSIARFLEPGGDWRFQVYRNEQLLADFLNEDDQQGLVETSNAVTHFSDALKILGQYPWFSLYPLILHPEYAKIVIAEVIRLGGQSAARRWKEISQPKGT